MIAYFKTINAAGGVNGHKIVLTYNLDDGGSPSQFTQLTHTLIDQDHVFAVGVASAWFTPGLLRVHQHPDLRLQRDGQLGRRPPTSSPSAARPRSTRRPTPRSRGS